MDNIDRLLDVTEHPERYSPAEIRTLLRHPEVKEVFDLLDKTKSSLQHINIPDVDAEWETFVNNHAASRRKPGYRFGRLFSRNVAAGIAVAIASFTAVAAMVGIGVRSFSHHENTPAPVEVQRRSEAIISTPDSVSTLSEPTEHPHGTVVFDNESFETIISEIASHYGYAVRYDSDNAKSLRLYFRWNKDLSLDEVVKRLNNFEQLHLTVNDKTVTID